MVNKLTKTLSLVLGSVLLVGVGATYASECNITCNHDGSTVTISRSCDITRTIDCRGNNIKLDKNVIVNIKSGGNLSIDLKNDRIELAPGAKINIDKNAKVDNIMVKPYIFTVREKGIYTMPNMTTPGSRGHVSKEGLQSWRVPSGVHNIKIDFDAERHEERCCDHVEFRIYKNGSRVYNLRKRGVGSQHVSYNMSVNPGDTIKIGYYEWHDRSVTLGHSYLKNIKITYGSDKYNVVIKGYIKGVNKVYVQLSKNGDNNYTYSYLLNNSEKNSGIVNDILPKLGNPSINSNTTVRLKLVGDNGQVVYSDPFKLSNSYDSISDIPDPTQPITVKSFTFSNLNDSSKWNYYRHNSNGYSSTRLRGNTTDGSISIYSKNYSINLQNKEVAYMEGEMKNVRIMDPDCRANGASIGWQNPSTHAQIRISVSNNGSYSWDYRGPDRSLGGRGNYYKLNNFSRGYKQLVIYLRDKNGKNYRYTYSAQSDLPDMEGTVWAKIDFENKKIYFKVYDNSGKLKLDKTFNINLPTNGLNIKNFGTLYPYASAGITCNRGGVPWSTQQNVPNFIKVGIKN